MTKFIMPIRATEIFFSYIYGYIKMIPADLRWKVVGALVTCYLLHLSTISIHHNVNLKKIKQRQNKSRKKMNAFEHFFKHSKNPTNLAIPELIFTDLSLKLENNFLTPTNVLLAFQKKALEVHNKVNCLTEVLDFDIDENKEGLLKMKMLYTIDQRTLTIKRKPSSFWEGFFAKKEAKTTETCVDAIKLYDFQKSLPTHKVKFSQSMDAIKSCVGLPFKRHRGVLHGIPVSLTEVIDVQMKESTAGLSSHIGHHASRDAVIVQVLKSQGAIPFIRTNVPQVGLHMFSSSNPIFGTTKHPTKKNRSPGGSSSGEGALLALHGSVLGVGTDIAGGLRIPAHFCGVCGLKPTSGRVSSKGVLDVQKGQHKICLSVGPMARDVAGLVSFLKAVSVPLHAQLDPTIAYLPFQDELFSSTEPLRIGFYIHDGLTKCVPAVERTVQSARQILEGLGHSLIEFEPPAMKEMLTELFLPTLHGNNLSHIFEQLHTDEVDDSLWSSYYTPIVHYPLRWLTSWYYQWKKNPADSALTAIKYPVTLEDWWQLMENIKEMRSEFFQNWQTNELDAILCPVLPFAALRLGNEKYLTGCLTYTTLFNLLDLPSGTVPFSHVTISDNDELMDENVYKIETYLEKLIKHDQMSTQHEDTCGLPIGVQIAALPYQEEVVLRLLRELEKNRPVFNQTPGTSNNESKSSKAKSFSPNS